MTDIKKLLDEKHAKDQEEIGAEKWEPEAGDIVEGAIQKIGWYDGGEYDPSMYLIFKVFDSQDTIRIYCSTVLRNQLIEETPAVGQPLAIRYEGKIQGKSRKYHGWTLALLPDENGDVKRDFKLWQKEGVYRGVREERTSVSDDEDDFF